MVSPILFIDKKAGSDFTRFCRQKNSNKRKLIVIFPRRIVSEKKIKKTLVAIQRAGSASIRDIEFIISSDVREKYLMTYIQAAEGAGFSSAVFFLNGDALLPRAAIQVIVDANFQKKKVVVNAASGVSKKDVLFFRGHNIDLIGNIILMPKPVVPSVAASVGRLIRAGVSQFMVGPPLVYDVHDVKSASSLRSMLDVAAVNKVLDVLKKMDVRMHINLIPACILDQRLWNNLKFNGGVENISVVSEEGEVSLLRSALDHLVSPVPACSCCDLFPVCGGMPAYYDDHSSQKNETVVWCAADIHAGKKNMVKIEHIFIDSKKCGWSKAFFLGDFVEGDEGADAWRSYVSVLKKCGLFGTVEHIAGNHEFSYRGGRPRWEYYKRFVGHSFAKTVLIGNAAFIPLHHKPSGKNMVDCSHVLIKREFGEFKKELLRTKKYIRVVLSHQDPHTITAQGSNKSVLAALSKGLRPDVWMFGHSMPNGDVNNGRRPVLIYCPPAAHEQRSAFISLRNGKKELYIMVRDHKRGVFETPITVVPLSKRLMLDS